MYFKQERMFSQLDDSILSLWYFSSFFSRALLSHIFYDIDCKPVVYLGHLASKLPGICPHIEAVNGADRS